jgi:hypothetical protein
MLERRLGPDVLHLTQDRSVPIVLYEICITEQDTFPDLLLVAGRSRE